MAERDEDYTTECLLDYNYNNIHYKLIAGDWSRKKNKMLIQSNSANKISGTIKKIQKVEMLM